MVSEKRFLLTLIVQLFSTTSATTTLFGMMIDFHSTVCSVVLLSQIFFTVPVKVLIVIISPILKGEVPIIENELKKSSINFCEAKATATHPIPNEAKIGVIATPIVSKKTNTAITQTRICKIVLRISVRFFLAFVSCFANHFSITTFRRYFITLANSSTKAAIKSIAKQISITLLKGSSKDVMNKGITIMVYQEIPEKSSKKPFLKGEVFATLEAT